MGRSNIETVMTPLYTASSTAVGGREGNVKSSDGSIDLKLTMPKEVGGTGLPGANPEIVFSAGYAACFESALRMIARLQKKVIKDVSMTCKVTLNKTEQGGFKLSAELHGHIPELPKAEAEALMKAAHEVCPYSVATRGNMDVLLVVD
jgi:lipoyl-dependent peroxiredoxin